MDPRNGLDREPQQDTRHGVPASPCRVFCLGVLSGGLVCVCIAAVVVCRIDGGVKQPSSHMGNFLAPGGTPGMQLLRSVSSKKLADAAQSTDIYTTRSSVHMRMGVEQREVANGKPIHVAAQQVGAAFMAASIIGSAPMVPPAYAAPPTVAELGRLSEGLVRINYLLDNWDQITTVCGNAANPSEMQQVVQFENSKGCSKSPLAVQKYIGTGSTLDPLFKADKILMRATSLVDPDKVDEYQEAVDKFVTKQQMGATMAYTSSFSGPANPNGSQTQIEENLLKAKQEVIELRDTIKEVVDLLGLPPATYSGDLTKPAR